MYSVTQENVDKVETFLLKRAKEIGSKEVSMKLEDIASGSLVAPATARRALSELENKGIIQITHAPSRRYGTTYTILADIQTESMKIEEYNRLTVSEQQIARLKTENHDLKNQNERYRKLLTDNKISF